MSKCWMAPAFNDLPGKLMVALPICPADCHLMLANLDWQAELEGRKDNCCVLSVDDSTSKEMVESLELAAWRTYSKVEIAVYPKAPAPIWPYGPNWAFQHTARYMSRLWHAWFWMEPDCVPLRPGWLTELNQEYIIKRKPVMGPIVKGMGHCNGTAIYPANFPEICPEAMVCTNVAWDGLLEGPRMESKIHDASRLMCHVWGIERGKAMAFGGEPAVFRSWGDVTRWVDLKAAVFHRAKNVSLIQQLRLKSRGQANDNQHPNSNLRKGPSLSLAKS